MRILEELKLTQYTLLNKTEILKHQVEFISKLASLQNSINIEEITKILKALSDHSSKFQRALSHPVFFIQSNRLYFKYIHELIFVISLYQTCELKKVFSEFHKNQIDSILISTIFTHVLSKNKKSYLDIHQPEGIVEANQENDLNVFVSKNSYLNCLDNWKKSIVESTKDIHVGEDLEEKWIAIINNVACYT